MTSANKLDYLILELLCMKREMSFTDLAEEGIMAKSTLNDHLHGLISEEAVRKEIGKMPMHWNRLVYVITAKGRRVYGRLTPEMRRNLLDYF
jgi:DNA-binding MarR family transcriptional regulator